MTYSTRNLGGVGGDGGDMIKKTRKRSKAEIRIAVRDMLRGLGFDTPDDVKPRRIVVHDDHDRVIESYMIGCYELRNTSTGPTTGKT